jgi:methyl-accepting chemotaxis protein
LFLIWKKKKRRYNMSEIKKDQSIRRRLILSFSRNTVLSVAISVVVIIVAIIMIGRYNSALQNYGYAQGDVGIAMTYFSEVRSATRAVIGYDDPEATDVVQGYHDEYKEKFEDAFEAIEDTIVTDQVRSDYDRINTLLDEYWEIDANVIKLGSTEDASLDEQAQTMAINKLSPAYNEINELLQDMMTVKVENGNKLSNTLNIILVILTFVAIGLIIYVMAASYITGKKISNNISDELKQLSNRMTEFAKGDLSSPFPEFDMKDEINDTTVVASKMAENIGMLINDIDRTLSEIANGNFMVKCSCPERYVGEFSTLRQSVSNLTAKMRETLLQIGETSNRVDTGSAQLSESANVLAQGAVDQAGAVQELTATIEDISSQAKESAKRIEEAYNKGQYYRDKAEEGREEVANLVSAMEAISKVSNEIKDIISEIEDIASQTNLLSLNASIEAARAGDAGKGFAVVADQIGKLASDSAHSAVRTRELIQNALDEVEKGNETMRRTNETLQQVVEGIEFLSNVSKDASESSYEQVNTMHEIEQGIEQIASVVESNSSSAEETSATGEELAAQATSLKVLTEQFILK